MRSVDDPRLSRNFGFWSVAEQQALLSSDVALAGVGGDGYLLGLSLVRMGVGKLRVADPEVFEPENINRVPGANRNTLGRPKVDCFVEEATAIDPAIKLEVFAEGVTPGNIDEFLDGADLVIDESELTRLELGTLIGDGARSRRIPNLHVMNVGFAAQVTAFHPSRGATFRDMIGVAPDTPLDVVAEQRLDLERVLAFLPEYIDIGVLEAVNQGAPLPSIVQGVNLASAFGTSQAFLHLVAGVEGSLRPSPLWFPQVLWIDSLTGESKVSYNNPESFNLSLDRLKLNNADGRVTPLIYPM